MISLDNLPPSCINSDSITLDIPHDAMKRSFKKVGTSKPSGDIPYVSTSPGSNLPPSLYSYWSGEDSSDGSTFNFVQDEEGNMAGSMVDLTNHNVLQIHNQNGSNIVTITASEDFAPEGDPEHEPVPEQLERNLHQTTLEESTSTGSSNEQIKFLSPSQHIENNQSMSRRKLYDDNGGNLDIMVIWTKSAECNAAGLSSGCTLTPQTESSMMARVNLAIQETNDAYAASGVNTELLLVKAYRHPDYVENDFSSALSDLRQGDIAGVAFDRSTYGADLVVLLIDDPQYCGLAYVGPRIDLMFSVTAWNCATGYYTFGHEVGHNLGLLHDRGTENACGNGGYNYGYRNPNGSFRTTLAYSCRTGQCDNNSSNGCSRIKRYSTPNVFYNGLVLGTSGENNVRAINDVRVEVAGYYEHVSSTPPTAPTPTSNSPPPTPSPTAAPTPPTATPPTPTSNPNVVQLLGNPCNDFFNNGLCEICTGDCDFDSDCAGDLRCAERSTNNNGLENVPGCSWSDNNRYPGWDFCE